MFNSITSVLSSQLGMAAAGLAVGAGLAAVNASHLSRVFVEALRRKLGVDPLAVYAPKRYVQQHDAPVSAVEEGESDGEQ